MLPLDSGRIKKIEIEVKHAEIHFSLCPFYLKGFLELKIPSNSSALEHATAGVNGPVASEL